MAKMYANKYFENDAGQFHGATLNNFAAEQPLLISTSEPSLNNVQE